MSSANDIAKISASTTTESSVESLFPVSSKKTPVDRAAIPDEERKKLEASGMFDRAVSFRTIPVVHQLPDEKKQGSIGIPEFEFQSAEHALLGDTIKLKLENGLDMWACDLLFDFYDKKLQLTYGQINALAGDFYGTYDPICEGKGQAAQIDRFMRAYHTLTQNTPEQPKRQPAEAEAILALLQEEVNKVNAAIKNHQDPSVVYEHLPDQTWELERLTLFRPSDQPSYLILTSLNLDHFGEDAETAYNAGHTAALQLAQKGDLYGAYQLNAFADHFLEDRFSAGHLRTPRRMLSGNKLKDLCSMFMHNEDNAIGLKVRNPNNKTWTIYGDKRLADHVDKDNLRLCKEAVELSAREIYDCWKTKQLPSSYGVWQIAPTLASARGKQDCCPLFVSRPNEESKEWRRKDIDVREVWEFTDDFWYWSTFGELELSSRWDYPITLAP